MKIKSLFSWMNIVVLLAALFRIGIIGQVLHYDSGFNWLTVCRDMAIAVLTGILMTFFCQTFPRNKQIQNMMENFKGWIVYSLIMGCVCLPTIFYLCWKFIMKVTEGFAIKELVIIYGSGFIVSLGLIFTYHDKDIFYRRNAQ